MLPDYKQNVFTPLKFRHEHIVPIQLVFPTGATVSLDTANSAPPGQPGTGAGGIGVTRTTNGTYTLNVPKGQYLHFIGAELAVGGAASGDILQPVLKTDNTAAALVDPTAGTLTLLMLNTSGVATDPPANARLYLTFLVGKA